MKETKIGEIIEEIKRWLANNENKIRSIYGFTKGGKMYKLYVGACMNNNTGNTYPCVVISNESDLRFTVLTVQKFLDVVTVLKSINNSEVESEIINIAEALSERKQQRKLPAEVVT